SAAVLAEPTSRSSHNFRVIARLKDGVSLDEAQSQMSAIAARLEQEYPASNKNKSASVWLLLDQLTASIRQTLYYLVAAVALVLLIACANVANLLLARASSRTREIAIRSAVGASRGRIVRQLITESLVLAVLAGVVGALFALWGKDALLALAPKSLARLDEVRVDGWVLGFTFAISVASCLLFGIFPALTASRVDLNEALKQGGTRSVIGGASGRMREGLVVVEIALAVVLVAAAGLLIRSFATLTSTDMGFQPEHLVVMQSSVPARDLESAKRATVFYRDLIPKIASLPNVTAASATSFMPGTVGSNGGYFLEGGKTFAELGIANTPQALFLPVAPGLFKTLGMQLRNGRDFDDRDTWEAGPVAIINEALARKSFPDVDPIGRRIQCGMDRQEFMTIVGVVSDIRHIGPAIKPQPEIYMPYQQHPFYSSSMSLIVRTASARSTLNETLRRKARELNPEVPVKFTTVEENLGGTIAVPRFRTMLLGIFAGLALCLAMAGIYGVMAFLVSQRTAEIGIRMALGATEGNVLGMILQHGARLTALGMAIGFAAAFGVNRALESLLFEVKATDPLTYLLVAAVMIVVVLAACLIPARRASQLDPLIALRQE
ncbi:MAG: ABC transporter permease, partial [Bryobacteraceae bacterium]